MFTPPHIGRQLAGERHRELLAEARRQRLAQQARAEPEAAPHRQPLALRLWRRLRPVSRPRLEPQAHLEPQE